MKRKNFLFFSLAAILGGITSRVSEAGIPPKSPHPASGQGSDPPLSMCANPPVRETSLYFAAPPTPPAIPLLSWCNPMPGDSSLNAFLCQCPACNGSGFRGEDRDQCGYCKMHGSLTTTETFGMYNPEGNAEVWRALVGHEWAERNWKEGDGPRPWLPGMLYYIGQKHPEVYDTAVRENIYLWLTKRFDKAHAEAQFAAFVVEVERNNRQDAKLKHLYERDDRAKLA